MKARDFCFWLQGYIELTGGTGNGLTTAQLDSVRNHLALVFKHEIDPEMGGKQHQNDLNQVHSHGLLPSEGPIMRC